jgi:hypothetical protein
VRVGVRRGGREGHARARGLQGIRRAKGVVSHDEEAVDEPTDRARRDDEKGASRPEREAKRRERARASEPPTGSRPRDRRSAGRAATVRASDEGGLVRPPRIAGACALAGVLVVVVGAEGSASMGAPGARSASRDGVAQPPALYALPAGCGPAGKKFACDPRTNAGCAAAKKEGCDDDERGGFRCYPSPSPAAEGGACDDDVGCQGGLGCDMDDDDDEGVCARYCCTNADCGSKACVVIDAAFGTLGFCQ